MLTSDAPGPMFYEPRDSSDLPCECERGELDRELKQVISLWVAGEGLRYDWRVDFDLMETVHTITGAIEYGLCTDCLKQARNDELWDGR